MSSRKHVKIAVHGVPRSGTSWIGEILNSSPHAVYSYQPLFSYAHKDYLGDASTREEIESFFDELLHCEDEFTNQMVRRQSGDFPSFDKKQITHIVYKEVRYINILANLMRQAEDVLLCAVIRNPLSVINSWFKAPREFRHDLGWSESSEWRLAEKKNLGRPEEYYGYEKWKAAASTFLSLKERYPDRVYIQKYTDMLSDPLDASRRLFEFCEMEYTEQTGDFVRSSTTQDNPDVYAVYKSRQVDNQWESELSPSIAEQIIADLEGTHLEIFLDK